MNGASSVTRRAKWAAVLIFIPAGGGEAHAAGERLRRSAAGLATGAD